MRLITFSFLFILSIPAFAQVNLNAPRIQNNAEYLDSINDSLRNQQTGISGIINNYTPILGLDICTNKIVVGDATNFNIGDTILMVQMKGAVIDSTNTASFGTLIDYRNAGNYEFNYVKSKTGNVIELLNTMVQDYDIPNGKVQLIRVPYYQSATVTNTLTCLPWDGSVGGVFVIIVRDTLAMNNTIDVSGKGFRGGKAINSQLTTWQPECGSVNYYYPNLVNRKQEKGEGIAEISESKRSGRGPLGNGGGGGNLINTGGGGGGNMTPGGKGGNQFQGCTTGPHDIGGLGGNDIAVLPSRLFMGGGGGAGEANDPNGPTAFNPDGGNGGGIIIIKSDYLQSNGNAIISNGDPGKNCLVNCTEGVGGGGAGGSIFLNVNNYIQPSTSLILKGGKGADSQPSLTLNHGPGGGGSGGVLILSDPLLPSGINFDLSGGINGFSLNPTAQPWGAEPGTNGTVRTNFQPTFTTTLFKPNIDSVRIKDSLTSCNGFDFKGQGYTNASPINSWQWSFGDGGTANTQNTSHSYLNAGTYPVKLVITDVNGCKDSIIKNVTVSILTMDAGPGDTICAPNSIVLQGTQTGGSSFAWEPAAYLNDPTLLNPTATPPSTTMFYLTVTAGSGCTKKDSVLITVRTAANFTVNPAVSTCEEEMIQLNAGGGHIYSWSPAGSLDNPAVSNPWAGPSSTTLYTVQITDTVCNNTGSLSTTVTVLPLPDVSASKSNDLTCTENSSQLTATGASTYSWSPSSTLNNPGISNPVAMPLTTTQYFVTGTDANGCSNQDSVTVNVSNANPGQFLMPSAFTPNFDGKNDCFGIKYWGTILEVEFNIYNRWGERIFQTRLPGACWDGNYKGTRQPPGAYIYWIRAKTSCVDEIFRKGTVVLIR